MLDERQQVTRYALVTEVLERALCHASLAIHRLSFLAKSLGLLPRRAASKPVLAAVGQDEVDTILAGFRAIDATPAERREELLDDQTLADELARSRQELVELLDRAPDSGLARIARTFALDSQDLDLLILALAPDWDLRIGRLFAFLNDHGGRDRPTVGHLLMASHDGLPRAHAQHIERLDRTLFDSGLLSRGPSERPVASQIVRACDSAIALSTALVPARRADGSWDALLWSADAKKRLRAVLTRELARPGRRRIIAVEGPLGSGRSTAVRAAASEAEKAIELVDLADRDPSDQLALTRALSDAAFRAKIANAVLVVRSAGDPRITAAAMTVLARWMTRLDIPGVVLLGRGEAGRVTSSLSLLRVAIPQQSAPERRALWASALAQRDIEPAPGVVDDLAARYDITPGRIHELVDELGLRHSHGDVGGQQDDAGSDKVSTSDVRRALRDTTVERMGDLARLCVPRLSVSDLVLPEPLRARLNDLINRAMHGGDVLARWAHADVAMGRRVTVLLSGRAGTGKSAAAMAVARALEVDLFAVDSAAILSKWVGETEQNLGKLFDEASDSDTALLFEGVEALFGARPSPWSDRQANLTASYLAHRVERHPGLVFFSARDLAAVDPALVRRCAYVIGLPAATEQSRVEMWQRFLPARASYASDVDLAALARAPGMEGADIRDALLHALLRAHQRNPESLIVTRSDLVTAVAAVMTRGSINIPAAPEPPTSGDVNTAELDPDHPYLLFWNEMK